jgi:hypothetical protein
LYGEALCPDVAVRVGAFVRGELQEGLGAGQVVEQLPGLAGEEAHATPTLGFALASLGW